MPKLPSTRTDCEPPSYETLEYHVISEHAFDRLVTETYDLDNRFSVRADEAPCSVPCWYKLEKDDPFLDEDFYGGTVKDLANGDNPSHVTRQVLQDLCDRGIIPEGRWLISE